VIPAHTQPLPPFKPFPGARLVGFCSMELQPAPGPPRRATGIGSNPSMAAFPIPVCIPIRLRATPRHPEPDLMPAECSGSQLLTSALAWGTRCISRWLRTSA